VLFVDEALVDYVDVQAVDANLPLLDEHPRMIVFRSFSKAWGLAGLRCGYAVGSPDAGSLLEQLEPDLGVNDLAQEGALEALRSMEGRVRDRAATVAEQRAAVVAALEDSPYEVAPTQANILWIRLPGLDGAELAARLEAQSVIVQAGGAIGEPERIRASVHLPEHATRLVRALEVAATVLVLLVLAAVTGAAPASAAERQDPPKAKASVVGGKSAPPGAYPWMVALSRGCGGSLIAPDRVLTAGHCVEDMRVSELRMFVGARTRQRGGYDYDGIPVRAVDVSTHPLYRPLDGGGPLNDVAILKLAAPVTNVPPVRLATPAEAGLASGGSEATVIGWGVTKTDLQRAPLATGLQQGDLRILGDRACNRVYGQDGSYRRSVMLCARSRNPDRRPNTSPCVGDSGGPLVVGGVQVGIVSFGISCGALHEPTVFSRVAALRPFIDLPEPTWAPQPLGRARVTGTMRAGRTATCVAPAFRGRVDRVRYRWGVNGLLVATGRRVRITRGARGKVLQCRAVAVNEGGATPSAASPARRVSRF
jgi:secreted trypsin-like serine protease